MGSVNKVILVGNLGADPEVRYTASGQAVANLRIATTERYRDRDNNLQEKTEWHRVVVWGRQAEHCKEYLRRGRQVYVEGQLETRDWTDRDGNKRYTTEVKARSVVFLGGRSDGGGGSYGGGRHGGGGYGAKGGSYGGGGSYSGGGGGGSYSGGGGGGSYGGGGGSYGGGRQPEEAGAPRSSSDTPPPADPPAEDGYFQEPPGGISDDDIPF